MTTLSPDAQLGLTTRFEVTIDGIELGGWSKCEGLAVTFKLHNYRPLSMTTHLPVLPDFVEYSKVRFTRAISAGDTTKVMQWLSGRVRGSAGGQAVITLLDSARQPVTSWTLRNVHPTQWTGPVLDAASHNVALEVLELVHEGFLEE
jgi:phage tail-like protein